MFINSLLFLFLLCFSIIIFFINNYYILGIILIISILLCLLFKVRLPIYKSFLILLLINFSLNYLLGDLGDAFVVTVRLVIMFIMVNLIMKKIGIYNLSYIIGKLTHSKSITLILVIALSFIPIMIKEISEIRKSLITKNYPLSLKNILKRPDIFVITFFSNLFKRVNDMEKVMLSKGINDDYQ